ncbi:thermosome subunit [Candidatus Woesearchaeota archaeon]|nr:thermosome subunit [Candidatus Woesearchaeota archaeon]
MNTNNPNVQPIYILPENTNRETGRNAQKNNILAAKLVGETIRTTLGPKGMDKMLVDTLGDVIVTNDGVTILKEMQIEHPAAKMLVEVAKTQEEEVGDGTTTAVVLAGELLKKAEDLLENNIHPTVIVKGYRLAAKKAVEFLESSSKKIDVSDKELLFKVANTAMTGKGAETSKEKLSNIVIKAVLDVVVKEENGGVSIDLSDVKIEKRTGKSVDDTELIEGIVLDKERVHPEMPKKVRNPKILLLDTPLEIRDTETDAKININDPARLQEFLDMEENMIRKIVDKVVSSGANTVFCQKGIDDLAQYLLAKNGVLAVRRISKTDLEKISKATGAKILTSIDDAESSILGSSGLVAEERVGDENMIFIRECKNAKSVTILVRGSTEHVIDEVKRALEDAVGVVSATISDGRVVAGAAASEIGLSLQLAEYANTLSGREQLAVNAFSESLEIIPKTLAENAGLDQINVLAELVASHKNNKPNSGVDVFSGKIINAYDKGIIEPLKNKTQAISSAAEVAVMILRIDDVIASGPEMPPPQGMPNEMGM